jgi:hypothetical protein
MKNEYNKIEAKDNMKVEAANEEVAVVEEKARMQKLVIAQPKKVKRNLFSRLVSGVMGPEGLPGIGAYVNEEIIKPAVKNIIFDAITSGLGRALNMDYRQPRGGHPHNRTSQARHTNYSNRYVNSQPEQKDRLVVRAASTMVDDYILEDRYEASNVLVALTEAADRYNVVSIADYYELIGVDPKHTDFNYGWSIDTITKASIMSVRGGYIIKFPPVEVI